MSLQLIFLLGAILTFDDRKLVVFGGFDGASCFDTMYEYRFSTQSWKQIRALDTNLSNVWPCQRANHSALMRNVKHHQMVVFGGWFQPPTSQNIDPFLNDIWQYDIQHKVWTRLDEKFTPDLPSPVTPASQQSSFFSKLFKKTSPASPLPDSSVVPCPRAVYASAMTSNDWLIIHSGYDGTSDLNDMYVLDLFAMTWQKVQQNMSIPTFPSSRSSHAMIAYEPVPSQIKLIVFGGFNGKEVLNDAYEIELDYSSVPDAVLSGAENCVQFAHQFVRWKMFTAEVAIPSHYDVILQVGQSNFACHASIIVASQKLQNMLLQSTIVHNNKNVIALNALTLCPKVPVKPEIMAHVMDFLYGLLFYPYESVPVMDLVELYLIATELNMHVLSQLCVQEFCEKMDHDHVIPLLKQLDSYELVKHNHLLVNVILSYIREHTVVLRHPLVEQLSAPVLVHVLRHSHGITVLDSNQLLEPLISPYVSSDMSFIAHIQSLFTPIYKEYLASLEPKTDEAFTTSNEDQSLLDNVVEEDCNEDDYVVADVPIVKREHFESSNVQLNCYKTLANDDLELVVLHVHKIVLMSRCEYFKMLFQGSYMDSKTYKVDIDPSIEPETMIWILQYIYGYYDIWHKPIPDSTNPYMQFKSLTALQLDKLAKAAKFFLLKQLERQCVYQMKKI